MAHQTFNDHWLVFRRQRKSESFDLTFDIVFGDLGALLQQGSRHHHGLADQRRLDLGIVAKNSHTLLVKLLAKYPIDRGRIAEAVHDTLNLHGLIADDLKADIVALLIQSQMFEPE